MTESRIIKIPLLLHAAVALLLCACAKEAGPKPFPDSRRTTRERTNDPLPFFASRGLADIPAGTKSAEHFSISESGDSTALFAQTMENKQGTVVAFEEWVSLSETDGVNRGFPRELGRRAVSFQSGNHHHWLIYYDDRFLYGVVARDSLAALKLARHWWAR